MPVMSVIYSGSGTGVAVGVGVGAGVASRVSTGVGDARTVATGGIGVEPGVRKLVVDVTVIATTSASCSPVFASLSSKTGAARARANVRRVPVKKVTLTRMNNRMIRARGSLEWFIVARVYHEINIEWNHSRMGKTTNKNKKKDFPRTSLGKPFLAERAGFEPANL
jgi:hypothetical protein